MSWSKLLFFSLLASLSLTLFVSSSPVLAQVVINEFLPDLQSGEDETLNEWVELFNQSTVAISLDGWFLTDSDVSHQLSLDGKTIDPLSFLVVKRDGSKFSLNNSGDTVYLFNSTPSATLDNSVDHFTYDGSTEAKSWGRIPSGSGPFINDLVPTAGEANQAPPTVTPIPTATPKPSPTPKPIVAKSSLAPTPSDNKQSINISKPPSIQKIPTTNKQNVGTNASKSATVAGIIDDPQTPVISSQSGSSAKVPSKAPLYLLTAGSILLISGTGPELLLLVKQRLG